MSQCGWNSGRADLRGDAEIRFHTIWAVLGQSWAVCEDDPKLHDSDIYNNNNDKKKKKNALFMTLYNTFKYT